MDQFRCVEKLRETNGKIYGYTLVDNDGKQKKVRAEMLKMDIRDGKVNVVNLRLTSNQRLIDTVENAENTEALVSPTR